MARFLRALILAILGVASLALSVGQAAAANAGGAAPGSAPAAASSAVTGGARPGVKPPQTATSARTGGAKAGQKPQKPKARRKKPKRRPATKPPQTPVAPTPTPVPSPLTPGEETVPGTFPLTGLYDFGGDDARFGAGRAGHTHQGQDVIAASGTPIVAPVAGSVLWKTNQPCCAGIYLVVRGGDGRDYVFMHIKRGTVAVEVGDAVAQGQQLAQVGATGDASGPHLHFEIWLGGWFVKGGRPIDPLPQLQRWAGLPAP